MRQIWIPREGTPEVLEVREAADPYPSAGQLRVRVGAAGLNFSDLLARMGLYPDRPKLPVVMGYEVAGQIDAVGDGVETDWIGRHVVALTRFGGHSDTICIPERQVFTRPPGMGVEEGAAFPVNYMTAYQLLVVMGGLRAGDTILIHSAGGGVGVAAVQLANRIGADVIGTASLGKHEFLKSIGVVHCVDYTREDFEIRVREITEGRGVELAVDAIGGISFEKSFRCLARSGRMGMYGVSSVVRGKRRQLRGVIRGLRTARMQWRAGRLINANKGVFGVNLGRLWEETERVSSWFETLLEYYREDVFRPVIARRFSFENAADAHHFLHDRRNVGKVLLIP